MSSKFGRQPAFAAIYRRNLNIKSAAVQIGVSHGHLLSAVNGHVPPSTTVRDELPGLLNEPLTDLFTSESLGAKHAGTRGPKPGWKDALLAEGGAR